MKTKQRPIRNVERLSVSIPVRLRDWLRVIPNTSRFATGALVLGLLAAEDFLLGKGVLPRLPRTFQRDVEYTLHMLAHYSFGRWLAKESASVFDDDAHSSAATAPAIASDPKPVSEEGHDRSSIVAPPTRSDDE